MLNSLYFRIKWNFIILINGYIYRLLAETLHPSFITILESLWKLVDGFLLGLLVQTVISVVIRNSLSKLLLTKLMSLKTSLAVIRYSSFTLRYFSANIFECAKIAIGGHAKTSVTMLLLKTVKFYLACKSI